VEILVPYSPPRHGEPAYYLSEYDGYSEGVKVRYQTLAVVRDDRLVEFPRIMGPSSNYPEAQDVFIFGGFEESCDALMDYADGLREDRGLEDLLKERTESSTLMKDYADYVAMANEFVKTHGRTVKSLSNYKAEIE
jgi:hypothetical protein